MAMGLEALDGALTQASDALLKRKNKKRLIIDLDSTEDPAYGKQEGVAYNGHFARTFSIRFLPLAAMATAWGPNIDQEMSIPPMAPLSSSSPWWSVTGPGSSFSGCGPTPPLPECAS